MFWLHEEDLPAGVGGKPFCVMHLVYLACFLAASVAYAFAYAKWNGKKRKTAERVTGSLVFFFGLCEYGITALIGRFTLYTLPLHVCSLMFSLILIHAWTNAARPGTFAAGLHGFLGAALFHPGILGAWAALLFPDWLHYPFWNYLSISGFMAHGLISVYGAALLVKSAEAADRRTLFRRDLKNSLQFMSGGAAVMWLFDRAAGTNYWFMLRPSSSSPFVGVYERGGYGRYLLAYGLTAVAVTVFWYGLRALFCTLFSKNRE